MIVYLCGTITADLKTRKWREEATQLLNRYLIGSLSPLRGKDPDAISTDGLTSDIDPILFTTRDLYDIHRSDVLLVYTLGIETLQRPSLGTWAEMGIGIERAMPMIFVADHPSIVGHPFVKKWASTVVPTLDEAVRAIAWLR